MTTFDYSLLVAGGFGLAVVFGYAFWVKVRTLRLQADLLEIYATLREAAESLGCSEDPGYLAACKPLDAILQYPEFVSFPVAAYLLGVARVPPGPGPETKCEDPKMRAKVVWADEQLAQQFAYHITHRTLTGGVLWLLLRLIPRKTALVEAREAAAVSAPRLAELSQEKMACAH